MEDEIKYKAVAAEMVLDKLDRAGSSVNIVILDACRNNPFKRFRSVAEGLASMSAPQGTLLAYATAPGSVARDGDGRNSPYTKHLVQSLKVPGLDVERVFKRVRVNVLAETKNQQVPWESSSLVGEFLFASSAAGGGTTQPGVRPRIPAPRSESPSPGPPGQVITNSIDMKLAYIPAGEFQMGAPDSEEDASSDEKPQHRVRITKPFYLGLYEVTQGEYERVMGTNPSDFKESGSSAPVERVSWEDAQEFCRKLSALPTEKAAGHVYRLPTEAEWEYACRAGSTSRFCLRE